MITLSDKKPFAQGANRFVYVHPHDDSKCIKIIKPDRQSHIIRTKFLYNFRSKHHYDENILEENGYREINALPQAKQQRVYNHIPRYYGCEKTDLGRGNIIQLIRDYDGAISQTLKQRLQQTAADNNQPCIDSINELKHFLQETLLTSRRLVTQNILSSRISEQHERLYIIDGVFGVSGVKELISLILYLPGMKKSRIKRHLKYLDQNIKLQLSTCNKD